MLRLTADQSKEFIKLKLEGKLTGVWIKEVEDAWQRTRREGQSHVVVDLCDVTFIDVHGKQLLKRMRRAGVEFRCCGPDISATVEEIESGTPKHE
jgi:anti-anti-sigma regulatory factor